jgi:hypothetical protein
VTGSGTTYTVAVSGITQDGTVIASIKAGVAVDVDGNGNWASTSTDNVVVYDTTPPTVTINQVTDAANTTAYFLATFSEAVTGFTADDVVLGGTAGATTVTISGSGATYYVLVTGMTKDGTVTASIKANAATDAAGNTSLASTSTDNIVIFDNVAPTVTVNQASYQAGSTNASTVYFTVVFSEAVVNFNSTDITLTGTAKPTTAMVTGSGTIYTVAVSGMSADGTVLASIKANAVYDAAGNGNKVSSSTDNVVLYDGTAPVVTLTVADYSKSNHPTATVTATDAGLGAPDGTLVYLDVDLNDDGDFTDAGELGLATGTLTDGSATLTVTSALANGTYNIRARSTDVVGNIGVSSASSVWVNTLIQGTTTTTLISSSVLSEVGNGESWFMSMSSDGRYVVFASSASNLVTTDKNGQMDIFVKDTQTGKITLVSKNVYGVQTNGMSWYPTISDDGRYVAFRSAASNLVTGDTNGSEDVFVKDLKTGVVKLVSCSTAGVIGNGSSEIAAISADGLYVVFNSYASNLVANDTNGDSDVFLKNLTTGAITLISTSSYGIHSNGDSWCASISDDDRYVTFQSRGTNLVESDTNDVWDVFVKDLQTGNTILASVTQDGEQGNGISDCPGISADGRYLIFESLASNFVDGDSNGTWDTFVKDLQTGEIICVSTSSDGVVGNSMSAGYSISNDDRFVTFVSASSNLVDDDTNGTADIFVKDLQTGITVRVSVSSSGEEGDAASGDLTLDGYAYFPIISADGRYVTYISLSDNLVSGDTNSTWDVFQTTNPLAAIIDTTPPVVTLSVEKYNTGEATVAVVTVTDDLAGVADGTAVYLDVDLNNDGDFTDAGETGFATALMENGTATFVSPTWMPEGIYNLQARVSDGLGNEGTSNTATITVDYTGPEVVLNVSSLSNAQSTCTVTATDAVSGIADGATVYLDIDLNNDGDFTDDGETGVSTATLVDGAATFSLNALASDGTYSLRARVNDQAGNQGVSDVQATTVDLMAPTVVLKKLSTSTDTSIDLYVTVTDAGSGVADGTEVYLDVDLNNDGDFTDSNESGFASSTVVGGVASFQIATSSLAGSCNIRACVADAAGNVGVSNIVSIELDFTPPTVVLDAPAVTGDPTTTITVTATDADSGVADGTTVYLDVDLNNDGDFTDDGETGYATAVMASGIATFALPSSLSDGVYNLQARVSDAAGWEGTSETVSMLIDTTSPTVTLTASDSTNPVITINVQDDGSGVADGTIVVVDVDLNNDGDFTDDGEAGYTQATLNGGQATLDIASLLADGNYPILASVSDLAGNTGTSDVATIVVSTAPVTVSIDQASDQTDPTTNTVVYFTVTFSEAVYGFDAGDISLGSSTAPGTLVASVTQTDTAGLVYRVAVTGMTGSGTIVASIAAGVVSDDVGNSNEASTSTDNSVTYRSPTKTNSYYGDFNGDGTSDVLWQDQTTGLIGIWIIKSTKYTSWSVLGSLDLNAYKVVGVGDFNGDGTSDVLYENMSTGVVRAWIVKNAKLNSTVIVGTVKPNLWSIVGVGDFNGDKTSDILWQNDSTGLVGAWIMKSSKNTGWAGFGTTNLATWSVAGVGDFNGDKTSDVLWQNNSTGEIYTWTIKSSKLSSNVRIGSVKLNAWSVIGVGDYNGDSTTDILWQNESAGVVCTWLIKQNKLTKSSVFGTIDLSTWEMVGTGNYNGDSTSDVLWQNQSTGVVNAWTIKSGVFSSSTKISTMAPSKWAVLGQSRVSTAALQAATVNTASTAAALTQSDLNSIVTEAIARWASTGLSSAAIAKLKQVEFVIADLSGSLLGKVVSNRIYIDVNAAGNGWFVDSTPSTDEEFAVSSNGQLTAVSSAAVDKIDLLTVVEHELGHILGFTDLDALATGVMSGTLSAGVRKTPSCKYIDAALLDV